VYGLCRRSKEGTDSIPLQVQWAAIEAYHASHYPMLPLVRIEDDGTSGSVPIYARPSASELRRLLQPGDHIVAAKVDRWSRSVADGSLMLMDLRHRGCTLHLLDLPVDLTTHSGRMLYHIMLAVAEHEREAIGERRRASNRQRRELGLPTDAQPPIGWRIETTGRRGRPGYQRRLVEDPPSRRVCRRLARLNESGVGYQTLSERTNLPRTTIRRMILAARAGFPRVSSDRPRGTVGAAKLLAALRQAFGD